MLWLLPSPGPGLTHGRSSPASAGPITRHAGRSYLPGFVALLLASVAMACGDDGDSASTLEEFADRVECADIADLDPMIAPIRGQAATRGISCTVAGEVVHAFDRAPPGDPSAGSYAAQQGGSVENIRRLVGAEQPDPGCDVHLVISDELFLLGGSRDLMLDLAESADLSVEPVVPASPTVSYLDDCRLR